MKKTLTHLTKKGVHMVEVGEKDEIKRSAIARGKIYLNPNTIDLIQKEEIKKGNVLTTAQIAAINAVKSTHHIIPLCHSLNITGINVDYLINRENIEVKVEVKSYGKTGVEMEALTGTSVALLTIWDMVKSVEKDENGQYPLTKISDIVCAEKQKYSDSESEK